ncbi:hypothetical protein ACFYXM_32020 [Streptomyces sp. NPDC002476]|uniref:hypothetical protein n=1 Tax=Streptomyces sp. NPDC002476 TaxID=3364648 RepID=UPI0036C68DB9
MRQIAAAGIRTGMCAETTARMGRSLGYEVSFGLDATCTFDLVGPWGGGRRGRTGAGHRRVLARRWLRGGGAERGADRGGRAPVGRPGFSRCPRRVRGCGRGRLRGRR